MTTQEMLDLLKQRTKVADTAKLLRELHSGYRWAVKRVYNAADGPDLLVTIGEELPALGATTKTYDLGANVTGGELLGVKKLWVKLPSDVQFVPMKPADTDDPEFIDFDSDPANNLRVAQGHPVLFDIINYSQARFAPALPTAAVIRADYYRIAPAPGVDDNESSETASSEMNEEPEVGKDLPWIFQDGMVSKATALLFNNIDDDREASWERRAIDEIDSAVYMAKRTKGPTETQPFHARRRRFL